MPWDAAEVCLSAQAVLVWREYERLILSSLEHADDMHLYYNMISFLSKGKSLEDRFGSAYFAYLLAVFTLLSNCTAIALSSLLTEVLHDRSYYKTCSIGFSGVVFALKVLTTHYWQRGQYRRIFGVSVSTKYAVWVELLLIQIMIPNASFVGHLAGILTGILFTKGPLKATMDLPCALATIVITSTQQAHQPGLRDWTSTGRNVSDEDYDEAIRNSLEAMRHKNCNNIDNDEVRRRRLSRFSNY